MGFKLFCNLQNIILKYITGFVVLLLLFLIMLLQSRTAVLSVITGFLYISYPYSRTWYNKQKIIFSSFAVLFSIMLFLSFFVKTRSSAGRRFIWKNCWFLLKENWLFGVGWGKFNPAYNHVQATFFSKNSITNGIALRANDGYYAFNEWLQIWIETGVFGFIICILFTCLILFICLKKINERKYYYGAVLVPLITSCIFSYPLHNLLLLFIGVLFSLKSIISYFNFNKRIIHTFCIMFIFTSTFFVYKQVYNFYLRVKISKLINEENTNMAYNLCTCNINDVRENYNNSNLFLHLLYNTNRLSAFEKEFEIIHDFHCNQSLHTLMGKVFDEKNDSTNAACHLLQAIYIAPYRLQSRKDLLDFISKGVII